MSNHDGVTLANLVRERDASWTSSHPPGRIAYGRSSGACWPQMRFFYATLRLVAPMSSRLVHVASAGHNGRLKGRWPTGEGTTCREQPELHPPAQPCRFRGKDDPSRLGILRQPTRSSACFCGSVSRLPPISDWLRQKETLTPEGAIGVV
jgi:hypothetical protein